MSRNVAWGIIIEYRIIANASIVQSSYLVIGFEIRRIAKVRAKLPYGLLVGWLTVTIENRYFTMIARQRLNRICDNQRAA
jgi:hypothetical protein